MYFVGPPQLNYTCLLFCKFKQDREKPLGLTNCKLNTLRTRIRVYGIVPKSVNLLKSSGKYM